MRANQSGPLSISDRIERGGDVLTIGRIWVLLAAFVLGTAPAMAQPGSSENLASVLEKNLVARGGLDTWRQIQTLQIIGQMHLPDGSAVPVSLEMKRPNRLRIEFELQGQTAIQTFDGQEGWVWLPFDQDLAPRRLSQEETDALAQTADFDGPLIDWRSKGYSLQYLGLRSGGEGGEGHLLELTRINGDRLELYLDPQNFLEFRQISWLNRDGETVSVQTDLSDYRPVDGVVMPFELRVEIPGSGAHQTLVIDQIRLGIELDDDRFRMQTAAQNPATAEH